VRGQRQVVRRVIAKHELPVGLSASEQ
jgi:hypothetical protein